MGWRPSSDSTVRQHETVMTLCDTQFHAQPHPIRGKVSGDSGGAFRGQGEGRGLIQCPCSRWRPASCPCPPPGPSSVDWFGCGAACRSTGFRAVKGFLPGWAGIFYLTWSGPGCESLCAWHFRHRAPSLCWAWHSLASSSAGGLGYLKDTGTG